MEIETLLCQVLIILATVCASQEEENIDPPKGDTRCTDNCQENEKCVEGYCIDKCQLHQCGKHGKCVIWKKKKPTCQCYLKAQLLENEADEILHSEPEGVPCERETAICFKGNCIDVCEKKKCNETQKCIPDPVIGYPEYQCITKGSTDITDQQKKLEEEKKKEKQKKLDEEKKKAEQKKLDEEKKKEEQKNLDEEKKKAEQKKLDEEKKKEKQRKLDEEKKKEEQKKHEEEKKKEEKNGKKSEDIKKSKPKMGTTEGTNDIKQRQSDYELTFPIMFMLSIVIVVAAYFIYHYRKKIFGLILEGQAGGKSGRYSKVSAEDVMPRLRNAKLSV